MAIAPDTPTISVVAHSYSCTVNYGVTSFGSPSTGTLKLQHGSNSSTLFAIASATKTEPGTYRYSDSISQYGWSNTKRYYRAVANNGESTSKSEVIEAVTLPPDFSISGNRIEAYNATKTSFSALWYAVALGTKYQVDLYASIDDGQTWTLVAQNIQNATEYTYTFTGLNPGTTYKVKTQARDSAGRVVDAGSHRQPRINTLPSQSLYGSVNNEAKNTTDLYGSVGGQSQRISKLYGGASGQAKLLYQGFGHHDYGYGVITYYTDNSHTSSSTAIIRSQSDVTYELGRASDSWTADIDGAQIPNTNIKEVTLTEKVTSIPNGFLRACTSLTRLDISRSRAVSIGAAFLKGCTSFNQSFSLPSTVTSVNEYMFLYQTDNMTGTVNVGSTPAPSSSDFAFAVDNSSAAAYTTGITIAGANRAAWISTFPNRTSGSATLRRLIDAGY